MPEGLSDLDKLQFYRDEVQHEFGLVSSRSMILVTCQSFLVVPFAILNTVNPFRRVLFAVYLVGLLGIAVAILLLGPIRAAHRTMDAWLVKQRALLRSAGGLKDVAISRDLIPGADADLSLDRDHRRSLAFSRHGPWIFCVFWIGALLFATFRAASGV